jgi:hypothetical protein|nr:MAG TPA: hypothetical protein [Caudoviricetes sp.]
MLEKQKVFFETLLLYFRPFCKIFLHFFILMLKITI